MTLVPEVKGYKADKTGVTPATLVKIQGCL